MAVEKAFIAFRCPAEQQKKLVSIAQSLGEGKNMSAALRWLVEQAPEQAGTWQQAEQQEREALHG